MGWVGWDDDIAKDKAKGSAVIVQSSKLGGCPLNALCRVVHLAAREVIRATINDCRQAILTDDRGNYLGVAVNLVLNGQCGAGCGCLRLADNSLFRGSIDHLVQGIDHPVKGKAEHRENHHGDKKRRDKKRVFL